MKKHTALSLALFAAMSSAQAGFIDERASAQRGVTPVVASGSVTGDFLSGSWMTPVPLAGTDVSVVDAIVRLLPPGAPAIEIEGPGNLSDLKVSWEAGTRRNQVVMDIARKHSLLMKLSGRTLTIEPVAVPRVPARPAVAQAGLARPTAALGGAHVAAPPVAPPVKALMPFDVRLSDIKLGTAFNRWALDAGVRIRWDANKHVLVGAPMTYMKGDILDAVADALDSPGIRNSDYPLEVCEYPNVPRLLRVTRKGEQAKDCPLVVSTGGSATAQRQ